MGTGQTVSHRKQNLPQLLDASRVAMYAHAGHVAHGAARSNYLDEDSGHYRRRAHTFERSHASRAGLARPKLDEWAMKMSTRKPRRASACRAGRRTFHFSGYQQSRRHETWHRAKGALLSEELKWSTSRRPLRGKAPSGLQRHLHVFDPKRRRAQSLRQRAGGGGNHYDNVPNSNTKTAVTTSLLRRTQTRTATTTLRERDLAAVAARTVNTRPESLRPGRGEQGGGGK